MRKESEGITIEEQKRLREIVANFSVPEVLFADEDCSYLLVSMANCKSVFADRNYCAFTGYDRAELVTSGGTDGWISKIHPDDRPIFVDSLLEGRAICKDEERFQTRKPITMNYRFRKNNGSWIWLQNVIYIVSRDENKNYDLILIRIKMIDRAALAMLAKPTEKIEISENAFIKRLTKREVEVLRLIGEGLSTKLIADRLGIEINTVETHRRHLLDKFGVKNSMELVKKSFKLFWLQ